MEASAKLAPGENTMANLKTPILPPAATSLDRVSFAPPADWVTLHEPDFSFQPRASTTTTGLLMDRQHHAVTHEVYHRTVQRLDTMQAVQHASQWRLVFDPATQSVAIHSLRIWRQGEEIEHAAPGRFRLLQREENLERLVLDGSVTLMSLLDDVRVGDVLDASFTVKTTPRIFRERFSVFAIVPDAMPLAEFRLSVRFPATRPIQWNSSGSTFHSETHSIGEENELRWTIRQIEPANIEPGTPSWQLPAHWLQVSDCASWSEVSRELAEAWEDQPEDPTLAQHLSDISAATSDLNERVDRAIALVQDEIRYLSMNIELGGQIPSPPGLVLRRRFGDCKDKSFLLAHMLRKLGLPSRPILVNTMLRQAVEKLLPTPDAFDHCIVEYDLGGQRRWIDVTISLQGGGALGRQAPNYGAGLPVGRDTAGLDRNPTDLRHDDRYILRETFHPDTAGGTSVLKVLVTARGLSADHLRYRLINEGEKAMAESRESFYRQHYPRLTRVATLLWQDDRVANEITLAETYEIPNFLTPFPQQPQTMFFEVHAHLVQSLLALPSTLKRKYPLAFSVPSQVEHWVDVEVPSIIRGDAPPINSRHATFQFWREVKRTATLFGLRPLTNVVAPEKFAAHRAAVEKVLPDTVTLYWMPVGYPVSRQGRRPATLPGASSGPATIQAKGLSPRKTRFDEPVLVRGGAPDPGTAAPSVARTNHTAMARRTSPEQAANALPERKLLPLRKTGKFDHVLEPANVSRRSSSRRKNKNTLLIAFLAILAVALVTFLIVLFLHHSKA